MGSTEAVRKVVAEAVNAGLAAGQSARARAEEIFERSRTNTEHVASFVRREIADQLAAMGLATKADLAALEARLRAELSAPAPAAPKAAPRRAAAGKADAPPPPAGSAARARPRRTPSP